MTNLNKRLIPAVVLAIALGLSACGGNSGADSSSSPQAFSSDNPAASASADASAAPSSKASELKDIDQVQVATNGDKAPKVTASYPFKVGNVMDKNLVAGSGSKLVEGATFKAHALGINASTGDQFFTTWDSEPIVFNLNQLIPGVREGLQKHKVGDEVLLLIPSEKGYDPSGQPAAKINPGDTLIFIFKILDTALDGPEGIEQEQDGKLPKVGTDRIPTLSVEGTSKPTKAQSEVIIAGKGEKLAEMDSLVSHALCQDWDGNEIYNDYDKEVSTDALASKVHQKLWMQLIDKQIGSRVLVVLPGEDAYPNGYTKLDVKPGTEMACVVDLLYLQKAPEQVQPSAEASS